MDYMQVKQKLNNYYLNQAPVNVKSLQEKLEFVYGHENLQGLYAKTSVSELKMKAMEEADEAAFKLFEEPETVAGMYTTEENGKSLHGGIKGRED